MQVTIDNTVLELTKGDITQQETDAVVNAANKRLAPGGGVAGAVHRAAGDGLWEECKKLGGCETGEAKITSGHNLKAPWIIHTVGPVYSGSEQDPKLLAASYRNSLKLAEEKGLQSISFPALSTGAFGYPAEAAARVALETVLSFIKEGTELQLIRFVLFDNPSLDVHERMLEELNTDNP